MSSIALEYRHNSRTVPPRLCYSQIRTLKYSVADGFRLPYYSIKAVTEMERRREVFLPDQIRGPRPDEEFGNVTMTSRSHSQFRSAEDIDVETAEGGSRYQKCKYHSSPMSQGFLSYGLWHVRTVHIFQSPRNLDKKIQLTTAIALLSLTTSHGSMV